jgi:ribonuclease HI
MERVIIPLGNGQVCEGEMEGLVQAATRTPQDGHPHVLCVADSQAALRGILSTKPRSGQFRAIAYDRIICDALHSLPHLTILNLWTLAHIGTEGNELADVAAKEATTREPDPPPLSHSSPHPFTDPRGMGYPLEDVEIGRRTALHR